MKSLLSILLLVVSIIVLAGCNAEVPEQEATETALEHALKHTDPDYVCPMHPQIIRGEPGSCPICGMDLVPKSTEGNAAGDGEDYPAISVSPEIRRSMGLRTTKVERKTLWRYIKTVGRVEYNEDQLVHLHPRSSGWVEKLAVRSLGEPVKKHQKLLEYYSPEIFSAQEEYIVATKSGRRELTRSAEKRLELLGTPRSVIQRIGKTGKAMQTIPLLSPTDGVIAAIGLREGMYIQPSSELFTFAKLTDIWVKVDVFEHQINWVRQGNAVEIRIAALPGKVWEGSVDYIYPELDPVTLTLTLRIRIPNDNGVLKPNMFADVILYGGPKKQVLAVPREALIKAPQTTRVVVQTEAGDFRPVEVETGMSSGGQVEILSGLKEGETIVESGQFLIDSESNLQASLRRFAAE
jgi:Cu(I)/Ag(I) efflux system membrane fusion protein